MSFQRIFPVIVCLVLGGSLARAAGGSDVTPDEALALAFPKCAIERSTIFLTAAEKKAADDLAGFDVGKEIVHAYVARREGALVGTAWFDAHKVRTKRETLMFVVNPDRTIRRIEVLAFAEPDEYLPRGGWYAQFVGRRLDDDLNLRRGIKGVTGATLTARATTTAARRVLALHAAVFAEVPEPPQPPKGARALR